MSRIVDEDKLIPIQPLGTPQGIAYALKYLYGDSNKISSFDIDSIRCKGSKVKLTKYEFINARR